MTKQQTSTRNWQKARLVGFNLDTRVLTPEETAKYSHILELKEYLLTLWDLETEFLIGHKLPPYKCSSCGKRSNKEYSLEYRNYCFKHYKEFKKEVIYE